MKLNLRISRKSTEDLDGMAEWIAKDSKVAAERLIDMAERRYEELRDMPGIGLLCDDWLPASRGVRRIAIQGFPNHKVYYEVSGDELRILRLIHGARDLPRALEGMLVEGRE